MKSVLSATLILFALAFGWAPAAKAWNEVRTERSVGVLSVDAGKSTVVQADQPFTMIALADPSIAETMVTNNQLFFVRGKRAGETTILLYGEDGQLVEMIELQVNAPLGALRRDLALVLPTEDIRVLPIMGGVFLEGTVSSDSAADRALQVAERYLPGQVTNGLTTLQSSQVMLEVRFVEASRDALRDIGFSTSINVNDASIGSLGGLVTGGTGSAVALFTSVAGENIDIRIDALESKGIIQTLARPNLVALSGDSASFLAGGEFPIPVAGQDGNVTVSFREFGVGLAFTPTVIGADLVNLNVRPEVSALDQRNGVRSGGVSVPALTVRRVDTTVELRDGQSFAIAGLLQNSISEEVVNTPLLSDLPILGALFSSKRYQKEETELVIIVTPRLVRPLEGPNAVRTPVDSLRTPSDVEFFLLNRMSGPASHR